MLFALSSIAIVFIIYLVSARVRRILLQSLPHIPGPWLAKVTYLYEFWFDVVLGGQYIWAIRAMHETYGPIVRINPGEIHIQDPDYIDEIFPGPGRKRDKETYYDAGSRESIFMTRDHELHRIRRAALAPYFSMTRIRHLQPGIEAVIRNLMSRLDECRLCRIPLPASRAFAALTNDIITEYAFANCQNLLKSPDLKTGFSDVDRNGARFRHLAKHWPWLLKVMSKMPESLLAYLNPEFKMKRAIGKKVHQQIKEIYTQRHRLDNGSKVTIFHDVLESDLPEHEKVPDRLYHDARDIITAGTLTASATLTAITFHLLQNPVALRKLKMEIMSIMPDPGILPSFHQVQQLPFMKAVVNEGLRLNNGVSLRLPRIATHEALRYVARVPRKDGSVQVQEYCIPPGTTVVMTPLLIHSSPEYFDDPQTFRPQRWLEKPELEKCFVPFSRGSRQCIGMNLAHAEIFLTLTAIFRRYGSREVQLASDAGYLELGGTTAADMEIVGDGVTPIHRSTTGLWISARDCEDDSERPELP
ncbi:Putative cytochrome P450 [Septoria linicola]|uniref:Cytochrome P450 n=1 Tax=Septoria linicola TaxID=215465 RepID=A0A9Q9B7M6_9PEZI|nr:Putative cytochrome P450 [Septoria linicola]